MTNKSFFIAVLVLLISLALTSLLSLRSTPHVVSTNLENMPMIIDGYHGTNDSFSDAVYDELNADKHVYRHYQSAEGDKIDLYIGYYGTAKGGRTGHNPYACLPSAGWGLIDTGTVRVQPSYYPEGVDANYVIAKKGNAVNVMLHWYQTNKSTILASGLKQNIERFKGMLFRNRNDGAYIQVNVLTSEAKVEQEKDKLSTFVGHVMELLPAYWPEEK